MPFGPAVQMQAEHGSCANVTQAGDEDAILTDRATEFMRERLERKQLCNMFTYTADAEMHMAGKEVGTIKGQLRIPYGGGGYVRDVSNPLDCRELVSSPPPSPSP